MQITFDPTFFIQLGSKSPLVIMWILFVKGGWIIIALMSMRAYWAIRLYRLQDKYMAGVEFIMLAIDIPKDSEQTPKAMEQVITTMSGAHQEINKRAKY